MSIFITILGGIALIAGIIFTKVLSERADSIFKGIICMIVGAILLVAGSSFTIVPTGYTGVRTTFGQVSEQSAKSGFNFKIPFAQSIKLVNNKQQDLEVDTEVWGETIEKTPVFASDIIVTYQISGSRSSWIYANVGTSTKNLIEPNLVASAIKSAMVELNVNEVTNRSKIEPLVKDKLIESLVEKYGEETISILKIVINNMDFEDSYNDAIAAKSIAQQTYEKQQIENNTAIAKAEADKTVTMTNAEAKAQSMLIMAQAEADSNKLLKESLSNEVLRSKFYDKWDGELPAVMGENSVITSIGDIAQ